ncbi:MAG TPA: GNAT family N-acetyltransferase [Solirubrobacteraceae bacterium]|nr:GNAT family N-acetyltransferase [Solirubrobacteraceae bacterium]
MTQLTGVPLALRAVTGEDEAALARFLDGLTLRSRYLRFCSAGTDTAAVARRLARAGSDRWGVVACERGGEIVGHAEYLIVAPGTAEVAVVVADAAQGQGLGTSLVARVAEHAARHGVTRMVATVLPDNVAMTRLFQRRFGATVRDLGGELRVAFPVDAPSGLPLAA